MNTSAVTRALRAELKGRGPGVLGEAARHLCLARSAKRARPRVLALLGRIGPAPEAALVDAAVAVELIHSASLLHDDVVDEEQVRRGRPAANVQFGNAVAVLAGDHLLARALARLAPYPRALTQRAIDVVAEMASATIAELEVRGRADVSPARWRVICEGKTGVLFGFCGTAAGLLAGDEGLASTLERAGRAIGLAFQLRDDLDDLDEKLPKDLIERNPSYPICVAAARGLAAELAELWRARPVRPDAARALARRIKALATDETRAAIHAPLELVREEVHALGARGPAAAAAIRELESWQRRL